LFVIATFDEFLNHHGYSVDPVMTIFLVIFLFENGKWKSELDKRKGRDENLNIRLCRVKNLEGRFKVAEK
jgi:hypothetical protein